MSAVFSGYDHAYTNELSNFHWETPWGIKKHTCSRHNNSWLLATRAARQRLLSRILVDRVISKWPLIKGARLDAYSPLEIFYSGRHNSITYFCKQSTVIRWSRFLFQGHCGWTHGHNFCTKEGHTAVKTIKVVLLRFNTWSTFRWVQKVVCSWHNAQNKKLCFECNWNRWYYNGSIRQ